MSIHHCQSVSETISFCCPFLQPPLHDQATPGDVKQALGRGNLLEEQKVRQEGQIYFFFTLLRSWGVGFELTQVLFGGLQGR